MKKLLNIILLLPFLSFGQAPTTPSGPVTTQFFLDLSDSSHWTKDSRTGYFKLNSGGGGTIPGGPITSIPVLAFNPGTGLSASAWIIAAFYASQAPTSALTGGTVYELTVSNKTHNLNWSYGRQSATATIASAVINPGTFNVFGSQPTQPGTISGIQSVTTTANTNTTYSLLVTTSDAKTATATTTDTFLPNYYYGRSATTTPNTATILTVAGGGNNLSASRGQTFIVTASGNNYIYFAYPSTEGALTSLTVGGFQSLSAFTQSTVSLTNASGFTQNYFLYVSNNTFSATTPTIITL